MVDEARTQPGGFRALARRPAFRISAAIGLLALAGAAIIGPDSSGWPALIQTLLIEAGVAVVLIGIGAAIESQITAVETRISALEDDTSPKSAPVVTFPAYSEAVGTSLTEMAHETLTEMSVHEWANAIRYETEQLSATPRAVMEQFRTDLSRYLPEAALSIATGFTSISAFEPDHPDGEISWSECVDVSRHGLSSGGRAWVVEASIVRLVGGQSWVRVLQRIRTSWGHMTGEPGNYSGDQMDFTRLVPTATEIATLKVGLQQASDEAPAYLDRLMQLLGKAD